MPQLPKLSYVLLSHNREKYIRAAIESAFAQDYEGELEYIFSDDCSTDRTFEIIKECVAAYKGNRRVVVTQTPTNLRSAGNFNHALSFAMGDWIIRADDDDISSVDRCSITAKVITAVPGCSFIGICSKHTFTDEAEEDVLRRSRERHEITEQLIQRDIRKDPLHLLQVNFKQYCHLTWNMDVYRTFGDLPEEAALSDDLIYYYRAAFLGKGVFLPETPLYFIRVGPQSQSRGHNDGSTTYAAVIRYERFLKHYNEITRIALDKAYKQLLAYAQQTYSQEDIEAAQPFINHMEERIARMDRFAKFWDESILFRHRCNKEAGITGMYGLLRCLPLPVFAALLSLFRKILKKR